MYLTDIPSPSQPHVTVSSPVQPELITTRYQLFPVPLRMCGLAVWCCTSGQQVAGSSPSRYRASATMGKLLTHTCLCHQAV